MIFTSLADLRISSFQIVALFFVYFFIFVTLSKESIFTSKKVVLRFISSIIQLMPMSREIYIVYLFCGSHEVTFSFFLSETVLFSKNRLSKTFCVNHEKQCRKSGMPLKLSSCSFVQFAKKVNPKVFSTMSSL